MKFTITIIAIIYCFTLLSCESNKLAPIEFGTVRIEYEIPYNGGDVFIEINNRYNTTVKSDSLGFQQSARYSYPWSIAEENCYEGVYFFYLYLNGELLGDIRVIHVIDY